jgi:hypothetical protein
VVEQGFVGAVRRDLSWFVSRENLRDECDVAVLFTDGVLISAGQRAHVRAYKSFALYESEQAPPITR